MDAVSRDELTFGLAVAGYALLAVNVMRWRRREVVAAAVVISTHVALVWAWRFEGSLQTAWDKGAAGFVLFHGALGLILAAAFVRERVSRWLVVAAFPIVSVGAIGTVFKYDDVQRYYWPVIVIATLGLSAVYWQCARPYGRRSAG
jgi:hypothetical protein